MIKFERIDIQNFNSIGKIENFEFHPGVHAVKGLNLDEDKSKSNGSGKSSHFDAITWCLYGKTPNGKKADAVVNRVFNKNCVVKLHFSIGEMQYRIERYRKHEDHNDDIKVFINDRDETVHPPSKNQETIDRIIRVPFELFTSSFVIAQGLNSRFTALTDFQRKETIENIRDTKVWDRSREINKKKISEIEDQLHDLEISFAKKDELAENFQGELRYIKGRIKDLKESLREVNQSEEKSSLEAKIEALKEEISSFTDKASKKKEEKKELDEEYSEKNNKANDIPDEISDLQEEIAEYKEVTELSSLKKESQEWQEKIEAKRKDSGLNELNKAIEEHQQKIKVLNERQEEKVKEDNALQKEVQKAEAKKNKLETNINDLKKDLEFYNHVLDPDHDVEECPTCGSIPGEGSVDEIKAKKKEREEELSKVEEEYQELLGSCKELEAKKEEVSSILKETKNQLEEVRASLDQKNEKYVEKSSGVSRLEGSKESVDQKITKIEDKLSGMGVEIGSVQSLIEEREQEIAHLQEKRSKLRKEISVISDNRKELSQEIEETNKLLEERNNSLQEAENRLADITQKSNNISTEIEVKKEDLRKKTEERKDVVQKKKDLKEQHEVLSEELPVYETLDKIFSPKGIRAHIISKDIGYINQRLDFYSKHFFSDMYVQLDPGIDEEGKVTKIDIPVTTTMNFDKTYEDCSGGEKRRIDICIQLSIFDLILSISSVTTNLLVLDEVFEGLDSEGVKAVMEVVDQISEHGACIYVISHLPNLGEYVDDEVLFVKENGLTEINDEYKGMLIQ